MADESAAGGLPEATPQPDPAALLDSMLALLLSPCSECGAESEGIRAEEFERAVEIAKHALAGGVALPEPPGWKDALDGAVAAGDRAVERFREIAAEDAAALAALTSDTPEPSTQATEER